MTQLMVKVSIFDKANDVLIDAFKKCLSRKKQWSTSAGCPVDPARRVKSESPNNLCELVNKVNMSANDLRKIYEDIHSKHIYMVIDSCSAEWQCFSCAVYKFAYLLTYNIWLSYFSMYSIATTHLVIFILKYSN